MSTTKDERDRLGETLHRKEKADEDRFFAEKDRAAIERLRKTIPGHCAQCGAALVDARCPAGHA
jgi:exonuclease I